MKLTLLGTLTAALSFSQVAVTTAQYDNLRTGANLQEVLLTTANVAPEKFGKLFSRTVDSSVYASPLFLPNLTIPGKGVRNVVFVCTMANTVYAFDADNPAETTPLWSRNLGPAPAKATEWIQPSEGIIGTPAIDTATGAMYVVAQIGDPNENHLKIFALDILTGADKYTPAFMVFPEGSGTMLSTIYTLNRAGLLIANNSVYVGIAFHRPDGTWVSQEGFVFRYALNNLSASQAVFRVTPTGIEGGIWQAGRGLTADSNGFVYAATSAGTYDGVTNFGSSVVKLHPATLQVVDWFTPANYTALADNIDLSAGGTIAVPGTDLLVAGGKEGVVYLLNRSNMGHLGGAVQQFKATNGCNLVDCAQSLGTAYWNRAGSPTLYVWDRKDALRAFALAGGLLQTTPSSVSTVAPEMHGGLTVTANGSTAGTGIVWAFTATQNADEVLVPGTLRAFDAADVTREIWNSDMNPSRDQLGLFTKFATPVVANGKVYAITHSNSLQVYGPVCGVNVTSKVTITRSGLRYNRATGVFSQTVTITNNAPAALVGPIHLAVDNPGNGVTLQNGDGNTSCAAPVSAMKRVSGAGSWLGPGATINVTLDFNSANAASYSPRVIAGPGAR